MKNDRLLTTLVNGFVAVAFAALCTVIVYGCAIIDRAKPLFPDPAPVVVSNLVNEIVTPAPATNTPPAIPFDRTRCTFKRIAPDVLDWRETRTLTVNRFTTDKLWSSCSGPEWPDRNGIQGCFGLVVEQPDGSVIVGTWDWNRARHQPMKGLDNLKGAEHSFFKLYSGARIWWFCTAFSRDAARTVLERTNFVEARWP